MSAGHMNPDGAGHPIATDLDRADAVEASQTIEARLTGPDRRRCS